MRRSAPILLCLALPLAGGCIPYATGSTAVPTPPGELEANVSMYFIPGGLDYSEDDSTALSLMGFDTEVRVGLDERSDMGVRFPGFAGVVIDYKRRLDARASPGGPAFAALVGTGVVNRGDHALLQAALLASGSRPAAVTPYGGVKAMHVVPLIREAVRDQPTIGVFGGLKLRAARLGITPEIGIFYDPSALGLRESNWIVVPSFTFYGEGLLEWLMRPDPGPRFPPYPTRPPGTP